MKQIIPPNAVEIEEVIIGAMLVDAKGVDEAMNVIKFGEVFYKAEHRIIYETIRQMYLDSTPIDLLSVADRLQSIGKLEEVGGHFNLIELSQKITSSAHIEHHCRIVLQHYIKRNTAMIAEQIRVKAYDDTVD